MKDKTLNMKIKDLPTTGSTCGFIRQLAGVSDQKYRDAHRCCANAREDGLAGPDTTIANKHINEQKTAIEQFVAEFGEMTVREYLGENNDD
jgi:hypothetical protein